MSHSLDLKVNIDNAVFSVLFIKNETFYNSIPKHSHGKNSYEIHYISSGNGTLIADGIEYSLVPNTLFVTGPNVEHEQIPDISDPMIEWCVYLRMISMENNSSTIQDFCNVHFWIGNDSHNTLLLFTQINAELNNRFIGYEINAESLFRQLIIAIIRNYKNKAISGEQNHLHNIDDSRYLIIEEYFLYNYNNLSLSVLSNMLGLSLRQTERILISYYGKNFAQKKLEAKMSVAKILLQNKHKSITETAYELGYSSTSHFSNVFKQFYNVTPSIYRNSLD